MRESCTCGWSRYHRGYFVERCLHEKKLVTPVHNSVGTPGGVAMSTPLATSAGVNVSAGTASFGASVESSPSASEEDETDDNPSSELRGRAARELRWLAAPSSAGADSRRANKSACFGFGGVSC